MSSNYPGYGDPATYPLGTVLPGSREQAEQQEWDDEIWPELLREATDDVLSGRVPVLPGLTRDQVIELFAHAQRSVIDAAEDAINQYEPAVRKARRR